jgi:hypothetical protein
MKDMNRVTREDISKTVGRVDDATVAEIIATGATADELAEAQAWIVNDEPLVNTGKPLPCRRVGQIVDILAEFELSEDNYESGPVPT